MRFVTDPAARLRGTATDDQLADPQFTVGGEAQELGPGGDFSLTLFDAVGDEVLERSVSLVATDRAGGKATEELTFVFDPTAPTLAVREAGTTGWATDAVIPVPGGGAVRLETRVDDEHLAEAFWTGPDGERQTIDGNALELRLPTGVEEASYRLAATDQAGNQSEITWTLELRLDLEELLVDARPVAASATVRTTSGRLRVAGALNRSADELTLRVEEAGIEEALALDGNRFEADVRLPEPGLYTLRLAPLEESWTLEYAAPQAPAGTTARAEAGTFDWEGASYPRAVRHDATGATFLLIEPAEDSYAVGERTVTATAPYYLSETEITWGELRALGPVERDREPRGWFSSEAEARDHPVVKLTFAEAEAHAAAFGGRLPTADEWLHAAAGTQAPAYPWGSSWNGQAHAEADETVQVRLRPKDVSWSGLIGTAGNAAEWCSDGSSESLPRILGGSFDQLPEDCALTSERNLINVNSAPRDVGFRVLLPLAAGE